MIFKKVLVMIILSLLIAPSAFAKFNYGGSVGFSGNGYDLGISVGNDDGFSGGGGGGGCDNLYLCNPGLPSGSISGIIYTTVLWLLGIFGLLGIIAFIISGLLYLTSAGEPAQAEKAKNAMKWAIFGIVVGLMGYIIMQAVTIWLGGASTLF